MVKLLILTLVVGVATAASGADSTIVNHTLKNSKPLPVTIVPPPTGSPTPLPVTNSDLGAKADAAASTDTGTFSLIALFKRALQKLTTIISTQTDGTQKAIAMPVQGSWIDRSGSITTGGSSQTLAAALATRSHFEFQNLSIESLYVNFGAAATIDNNSFRIVAGAGYNFPAQSSHTGTITVIGATTGSKFVAKEL